VFLLLSILSIKKQTKMPFFKNGEQEDKTVPVWGVVTSGSRRI
jgi:hypothetical protein